MKHWGLQCVQALLANPDSWGSVLHSLETRGLIVWLYRDCLPFSGAHSENALAVEQRRRESAERAAETVEKALAAKHCRGELDKLFARPIFFQLEAVTSICLQKGRR
jgi:hypothetical protein